MAYRVQRLREGFYVFMVLKSSHGEVVKELERRLKVADPVMKYMTVRVDEELKRQDKLKRHREKRAARRPRKTVPSAVPPAGPAAAPAAAGGSEPAAAAS
jgi:small subunit ribosomal protein S6